MCQGAIVSLIQFKPKKRTKSIVLKGIGSHSQLVQDNLTKLTKAGWNENLPGQKVFSIESNFSAWNKFTVESGEPGKKELKILKTAYKEIAGSPSALIRHVLKCGKIDDALIALLKAAARAEYGKVTAAARAEYDKVTAPARAEYGKVTAAASAEYGKVTAPARAEYDKVTAAASAEYDKVTAAAWVHIFRKPLNRVSQLR